MRLKNLLKQFYLFSHKLSSGPRLPLPVKALVSAWVIASTCLFLYVYFFIIKDLPNLAQLEQVPIPQTSHIKDRHGITLYKVYATQNRTLTTLDKIPKHTIDAFLSIEDKDFYSHPGFSLSAITRALLTNIRLFLTTCLAAWEKCDFVPVQGGSTITQQLVKTALLSPEKSINRKIKEIILAIQTEQRFSKNEILEMYLNRINFGGSVYGIEEAAQQFFGIPASQLSLAQSSLLAGLPAAPTTYSPFSHHPQNSKNRQSEVLRLMAANGFISWETAQKAASEKIIFAPPQTTLIAPHFVMYIKELITQKYGQTAIENGGLEITTTLDLQTQLEVEKILSAELAKISHLRVSNGAALVTNPQTGEILAMVGSKDYSDPKIDGNVNVIFRPRQPGSSIKPLNYALGLQNGLTPATLIMDTPITYKIPGQPDYSPVNYNRKFHGPVTLRTALASSYNIPAVKILEKNGVQQFIAFAQQLGINTWQNPERYGLSLTLGGGEVTMYDLATAYGVFANQGNRVDLNPIIQIKNSQGKLIQQNPCLQATDSGWQAPPSCPQTPVLDPRIAYLITDILADNDARAPAFGPNSQLRIKNHRVAVKTGTTDQLRDNWAIGYTPNLLVAVWVGNNDNTPMSYVASGVTGASPIWRAIFDLQLKNLPPVRHPRPAGLYETPVSCGQKSELFLHETPPPDLCLSTSPTPHPPTTRQTAERKNRRDIIIW